MECLLINLGCIFILLVTSCSNQTPTMHPVRGNIVASVYASGIVKARNQYEVFSKVSGIVTKVFVSEGDTVKAGQPLMQIMDESVQLTRDNAGIAAAFNSIYSNQEKIQELKNNIMLAQARYSIDSLNYCRQKNLFTSGIGSRNDLEQRELSMFSSKNAMESALHTYSTVMKQLRFNQEQSNTNLLINKSSEQDYTIMSEINGRVYRLNKLCGEMVNPTMVLAVLGDANHFYAELQVDEYDISKIRIGQEVVITMDSYEGKTFEAVISKISPIMDSRMKTFTVEAEFVSRPDALYPFLTVEANIIIEEKNNVVMIPRNYLINDSFVMLSSGRKPVLTGVKDYEKVEVISGLSTADVIYQPQP